MPTIKATSSVASKSLGASVQTKSSESFSIDSSKITHSSSNITATNVSAAIEEVATQVAVNTSEPASPSEGDLWYDSDDNIFYLRVDSAWKNVVVADLLDQDNFSSNSATAVATQQSIKAYVDAAITGGDLDLQGDSGGALSIDLDSETLTLTGGTGVDTAGSSNTITFSLDLNELGTEGSIADADFLSMVDATDNGSGKVTFANLQSAIVATGALNSGSITSGFGTIDIGSSGLTAGSSSLSGLSLLDGNITNVGDINCDSISIDDAAVGLNIDFGGNTTLNKLTLTDNLADALNITESSNSYLKFVTSNSGEKITLGKKLEAGSVEIEGSAFDIDGGDISAATISGGLTWSSAQNLNSQNLTNVNIDSGTVDAITSLTVGTDGSGSDVYFYSATSGDHLFWDASEEKLTITGTNGQTALDVADGNLVVADNIDLEGDIDVNGTSNLDVVDIDGAVDMASTLTVAGVIDSNDATDSSSKTTGSVKIAGGVGIEKKLYVGTDLDVDGTANLDVVDIDGAVDMATTLALAGNADFNGDLDVDGTTNLDNTDIDGTLVVDGSNISLDSTTTLNIDNSNTSNGVTIATATSGVPISLGHSTSETTVNDNLTVTGNATVSGNLLVVGDSSEVKADNLVVDNPTIAMGLTNGAAPSADSGFDLGLKPHWHTGSTAKTAFIGVDVSTSASAPKLTYIPDASFSSDVVSGSVGIIVANLEGNVTGNVTGNTSGTAATVTGAAQTNITSLGTLTTLTVDNVIINATTIGHTDDTDLMTLADGVLTVAGEISMTTLDIGGTNVTSTAAELNLIDGGTSRGTTSVASGDGILINDAGTMRMTNVDTVSTYFSSHNVGGGNIVTTGALNSGSITSGFGNIDTGSSTITTTGLISGGSLDIDNVLINGTTIGHTDDTDLITVADGLVTVAGEISVTTLDIGGTNVTSTAAELNALDGITAVVGELNALDIGSTAVGTAVASKAVILDSNKDYTGLRNLTITGELDAATLDISGAIDVAGTTNLDAVDIDGAVQIDSTITVGANDQGYDIIFYGDAASANMTWDTSVDDLIFNGAARVVIPDGQLVLGSTAVSSTAAELNLLDGVTATTTELNLMDGGSSSSSVTVADGDQLILNDGGTMKQITVQALNTYVSAGATVAADDIGAGDNAVTISTTSGAITIGPGASDADVFIKGSDGGSAITALTFDMSAAGAATFNDKIVATELDISNDVDIDGTLEADAITVDGTALATYIRDTVGTNMVSSNTETGITVTYDTSNDNLDFAVDAAQTGITSLFATDIKIGEDDQTKIDFETADEIHFYANNTEQVYLADNIFGPQSDSDVDLGTTGVRWKDAFVDSITVTGNGDIDGNLDVDGTTNLDAVDIDDAVQIDGTLTVGVNDTGHDVKFFGATAGSYMLYDQSDDSLKCVEAERPLQLSRADGNLHMRMTAADDHSNSIEFINASGTAVYCGMFGDQTSGAGNWGVYNSGFHCYIDNGGTFYLPTANIYITNSSGTLIASDANDQNIAFAVGGSGVFTFNARCNISGDAAINNIYLGGGGTADKISPDSNGSSSNSMFIGNQQITTSSDIRLKKNITDTTFDAVSELKKLRVVDFTWDDPSDKADVNKNSRGKWTGLIAQEVVEHLPYVVNAVRDLETNAVIPDSKQTNDDGEEVDAYWGLEYDKIVPVLIKAVQELSAKVTALENK